MLKRNRSFLIPLLVSVLAVQTTQPIDFEWVTKSSLFTWAVALCRRVTQTDAYKQSAPHAQQIFEKAKEHKAPIAGCLVGSVVVKRLYDEHQRKIANKLLYRGPFKVTDTTTIKTRDQADRLIHIVNMNAPEGTTYTVTKNFHTSANQVVTLSDSDHEDVSIKASNSRTFESPVNHQENSTRCMYKAMQLYFLFNKQIKKKEFDHNLQLFDLDGWPKDIWQYPIDMVSILREHFPEISQEDYTVIPTILDENYNLAYMPFISQNKQAKPNFDQDASLLKAIKNIHDNKLTTYTHLFFLNDTNEQSSMESWIPVVLHKENNQVALYYDQADRAAEPETFQQVITKGNACVKALIKLLSINPKSLELGLRIAKTTRIRSDDYRFNYQSDIVAKVKGNTATADDLRSMLGEQSYLGAIRRAAIDSYQRMRGKPHDSANSFQS